ncbi:FUN14 domain-containing protein [Ceratobasidium theobromae]|uniref:FUN14 domain-containing protein n=1 Tax=Ceratobasidium theobromae TaxID=1582974 RepID=A0A5N5QXK3_9AGAM|nr:FUN14 domain-containing protein [Ceratobasidium theobromae]
MNAQLFRKSNHVLTSAYRLGRQPCIHTRSFVCASTRLSALRIEGGLAARTRWTNTTSQAKHRGLGTAAAATVGLGLAAFAGKKAYCEPSVPSQSFAAGSRGVNPSSDPPPPPKSSLNTYELTFGSLAGICAGVFIKKGARAVAFFLGGIFVLLQYFNAINLTKTDWSVASARFERLFYSPPTKAGEPRRPPTIAILWKFLVDFLTADFPPRASFLAGLVLGLRMG